MVWTRTLLSSHLIISIAPVSCSRTHAVCRCWWVMRSNIVSLLCSFGKWQNLLFLPQACIGWWVPAQKKPLSFELLGFSSKPHPGWVGSVFRLASVCHWERKTKMSFCHRDDKKKKQGLLATVLSQAPECVHLISTVCCHTGFCQAKKQLVWIRNWKMTNRPLKEADLSLRKLPKDAAGQNRETDTQHFLFTYFPLQGGSVKVWEKQNQ